MPLLLFTPGFLFNQRDILVAHGGPSESLKLNIKEDILWSIHNLVLLSTPAFSYYGLSYLFNNCPIKGISRTLFGRALLHSSAIITTSLLLYRINEFLVQPPSSYFSHPRMVELATTLISYSLFSGLVHGALAYRNVPLLKAAFAKSKVFFLGGILYNLLDDGIANLFVLETLRHGTSIFYHPSIRLKGLLTSRHNTGASSLTDFRNTIPGTYCLKDRGLESDLGFEYTFARCVPAYKRLIAAYYGEVALLHGSLTWLTVPFFIPISSALVFKIRFNTTELHSLQNRGICEDDKNHKNHAWLIKQDISPLRIGLLGSLYAGANSDWFARVAQEPQTVVLGLAQIACAAFLLKKCFQHNILPSRSDKILACVGGLVL